MATYNTLPFRLKGFSAKPTRSFLNVTLQQLEAMQKTINAPAMGKRHMIVMPESEAPIFMRRYYDKFPLIDFFFVRIKGWDPKAKAMDYAVVLSRETMLKKDEFNWKSFSNVDWLKDFKNHVNKRVMSNPANHEISKEHLNEKIRDTWDRTSHEQVIRAYDKRKLIPNKYYAWFASDYFQSLHGAVKGAVPINPPKLSDKETSDES